MTAIKVVSYIRPTDGREPKFDSEYYLKTHMPLVQQRFAPYGLLEWETIQEAETSPYYYVAVLHFENIEGLRQAIADHGPEVFGDIKNFTDMEHDESSGTRSGYWKK